MPAPRPAVGHAPWGGAAGGSDLGLFRQPVHSFDVSFRLAGPRPGPGGVGVQGVNPEKADG